MTGPRVRHLRAGLTGPLARLEQSRDDLAKSWIVRVIERSTLEQIQQLPTDRVARELPELIADILRAVAEQSAEPASSLDDEEAGRLATRLAEMRGQDNADPKRVTSDVVALQSVMVGALARETHNLEPPVFVDAVESLTEVFAGVQVAALEAVVGGRSRELELLANTDPLTGLYNVRYLQEHIQHLVGVQKRYGHPFAVLALDVDGLKRINDAYGHAAGDKVLTGVADALRATLRNIDTAVRTGGDEFCVLVPHQTASRAQLLGQRIGAAIEELEAADGSPVGISIGVVSCPQHAADPEVLLSLADSAMYRAKAAGQRLAVGEHASIAWADGSERSER